MPVINKASNKQYLVIAIVTIIVTEFLAQLSSDFYYVIILMNLPYLLIFTYGAIINKLNSKNITIVALTFALIYIIFLVFYYFKQGCFVCTQTKKYPPQLFYTSYAVMCISLLWLVREKLVRLFDRIKILSFTQWIGSHTIWIYFWHIPMVTLLNTKSNMFILKFVLAYGVAILITYIQNRIVTKIISRSKNEKLNKDLSIIFKG